MSDWVSHAWVGYDYDEACCTYDVTGWFVWLRLFQCSVEQPVDQCSQYNDNQSPDSVCRATTRNVLCMKFS
jgi:hypothetical protein